VVQLAAGDEPTTLTLTTWFDAYGAGTLQGRLLDVEDVDGCQAGLVAAGVECSDLGDEPWGRYFTCKDVDGNGLVVAKTARRANAQA